MRCEACMSKIDYDEIVECEICGEIYCVNCICSNEENHEEMKYEKFVESFYG
jgi:hypothetical protein